MDAQELKIGNYVYTHNNVVVNLTYERFRAMMQIRDEDLEPIPLTEEWLVKFGFYNNSGKNGWYKKEDFKFTIRFTKHNGVEFHIGNYQPIKVKYVHQFQNAYYVLTN
tara:strand:- start:418 stop:741 length:324 start_codon:yes stop_codon:yes gene_type:complete